MIRAVLLALPLTAPALAQETAPTAEADPDIAECVSDRIGDQAPVAECVRAAAAPCEAVPAAAPALAAKCFIDLKEGFGVAIAGRMDRLEQTAPDQIVSVAGIEVKYDLMTNLLQCDRMSELRALRADPGEGALAQDAACQARATGLAYAKLLLQSSEFE